MQGLTLEQEATRDEMRRRLAVLQQQRCLKVETPTQLKIAAPDTISGGRGGGGAAGWKENGRGEEHGRGVVTDLLL